MVQFHVFRPDNIGNFDLLRFFCRLLPIFEFRRDFWIALSPRLFIPAMTCSASSGRPFAASQLGKNRVSMTGDEKECYRSSLNSQARLNQAGPEMKERPNT